MLGGGADELVAAAGPAREARARGRVAVELEAEPDEHEASTDAAQLNAFAAALPMEAASAHGLAFVWPLCEEAGVLQSKNVSRHAVVGQALAHTSTDCRRYETLS